MDIAIQMRSIELMLKFLKHDLKNVPSYGYALQKRELPEAKAPKPLPRSTPEAEGIRSDAVLRFYEAVSAEADSIAAHAMLVMRHGKVIAEGAWAPYRLDVPHMLYSMSKSVTGTAVGIAVDEGLLSLEERLADLFPELVTPTQAKVIKNMTVRHLLTMSTGCRFNEIGSMLDENWAKMFLESLPKFEPGTAFEYNSLNTYMLAAILARRLGAFAHAGGRSQAWPALPEPRRVGRQAHFQRSLGGCGHKKANRNAARRNDAWLRLSDLDERRGRRVSVQRCVWAICGRAAEI